MPQKQTFLNDVEIFDMAIVLLRDKEFLKWENALERLEQFKIGCAGLNPAAYRELTLAAQALLTTHRNIYKTTEQDWDHLQEALAHAQEPTP